MNAELLAILEYWEREKGINRNVLLAAVEEALLSAAKKAVGPARELRVAIDPKNGDIKAFAKLIATDKVISKHDQISIFRRAAAESGCADWRGSGSGSDPNGFRPHREPERQTGAHAAYPPGRKAVDLRRVQGSDGDIVSGVVRRFDRSDVILDLGKYEALLPNANGCLRRSTKSANAFAAMFVRLKIPSTDPKSFSPEPIPVRGEAFHLEVSEISDGTIEVKGIAREPASAPSLQFIPR
jgi:N utilization substance protein A